MGVLDQDWGRLLLMLLPHTEALQRRTLIYLSNLPLLLHWTGAGRPVSPEVRIGAPNVDLSFSQEMVPVFGQHQSWAPPWLGDRNRAALGLPLVPSTPRISLESLEG